MQLLIEETVKPSTLTQSVVPTTKHRRGRISNKLPLEVLMSNIKGMFVNYTQYREYVKKHNLMKHGYPLNPKSAYKYDLSVDQFLGNPEGTCKDHCYKSFMDRKLWKVAQQKRREIGERNRRIRAEAQLLKKQEQENFKLNPVVSSVHKTAVKDRLLDMEIVCDFLIHRGMTNTVKNILSEPKVTLDDARMISSVLLKTYEDKTLAKK